MMETCMWTYRGDPKPLYLELAEPFAEPDIRFVAPAEQVSQIVSDLQDEGMTGVVERTEILRRYPEYCWMHGWIPHAENHVFEALGKLVKRVRPFVKGQRITGYVIPDALPMPEAWPEPRTTSLAPMIELPRPKSYQTRKGSRERRAA